MLPHQIVLASGNQKKLKEIQAILAPFEMALQPQSAFTIDEAVEDGLTFVENALIKARHACRHTGLPAIADDSGIEVDYLQGRPGIYSARFAGQGASDEANLQKLLSDMQGAGATQRVARYFCAIVYLRHAEDPTPIIAQAYWQGVLREDKLGDGGFGYDPIFYSPEHGMTAAQMSPEQKATVSHRGKALREFERQFRQFYHP